MRIRRIVHAGVLLTTLALVPSCAQYDEEVTGLPNTGVLRIDYTIDGQLDEDVCAQIGADRAQLVVLLGGRRYTDVRVACESFAVSIDLPADVYDASLSLIDVDGEPVSRVVELSSILVEPGGTARSIDFEPEVTIEVPGE